MQIIQVDVLKDKQLSKKAKQVYLSAFPRSERLPWWVLRLFSKRRNIELCAYLADGAFCGLTYHFLTDHGVMIMFFAVDAKLRAKGYGSAILSYLKQTYADKALLLHVEPLDETDAPNYGERVRRLAFYKKNGFGETGWDVFEIGGRFSILACGTADIVTEYRQAFKTFSFGLWKVRLQKNNTASKDAVL